MNLNGLYLAVVDVENTGHDDERDTYASLLEIGVVVVDASTPDLVEVGRGEAVIRPPGDRSQLDLTWAQMPPVVQQMHTDNGLWAEATGAPDMTRSAFELDPELARWLDQLVPAHATIGLAGSGVGHHDDRWLRAHLPRFRRRMDYWNLDSSAIRRALVLAGRDGLVRQAQDVEAKPHRGLGDALLHAEELRYYLRLLGGLQVPVASVLPLPGAGERVAPEDMVE